jgi:hypothetical protein
MMKKRERREIEKNSFGDNSFFEIILSYPTIIYTRITNLA